MEQQVSLGNDEVDPDDGVPADFDESSWLERIAAAQSDDDLRVVWDDACAEGVEKRIQRAVIHRKAEVQA